jgi:lysophospholipase L1-like esterase
MRIRSIVPSVFVMLIGLALAHATSGQTYYVALGDSLAIGYQPSPTGGPGGPTSVGYADDLFLQLKTRNPSLMLEKLGCFGETTSSMIQGGAIDCPQYPTNSSQLDAAVGFLQAHPNQVALITLDIGANDVDGCVSATTIDSSCVQAGFASVSSNLPWILLQLRKAAGPHTPIVAMNYYDPFLAAWKLGGSGGHALAIQSLQATTEFNVILGSVYLAFGVPVADVAQAFRIYNFLPVPGENVPVNVFLTFVWTGMILTPPDVHPNTAGYAVIAGAFANKISLP